MHASSGKNGCEICFSYGSPHINALHKLPIIYLCKEAVICVFKVIWNKVIHKEFRLWQIILISPMIIKHKDPFFILRIRAGSFFNIVWNIVSTNYTHRPFFEKKKNNNVPLQTLLVLENNLIQQKVIQSFSAIIDRGV